jgi:hypothetical protein
MTADCSNCGRVAVRRKRRSYGHQFECRIARREHRGRLWETYNITDRAYAAMLRKQKGRCAICGVKMIVPCVDHCHDTGKVRGLLCHHCNTGLGMFKDNPKTLKRALAYLAG